MIEVSLVLSAVPYGLGCVAIWIRAQLLLKLLEALLNRMGLTEGLKVRFFEASRNKQDEIGSIKN